MPNKQKEQPKTVSPKYTLSDRFRRFNERNNIFGRLLWDTSLSTYGTSMYENVPTILQEEKEGYSRLDFSLAIASWTVHDYFHGAFTGKKLGNPNNIMGKESLEKYEITEENIAKTTAFVKHAAQSFGASLVGITAYDERWTYTNDRMNKPIKMPAWVTTVIALAIEMEPLGLGTSPSMIAGHANGLGYSKMAFLVSSLAEFIRELGYQAISSGNDTGLSIPIAINAGLGQLGRNGLLITEEFGPRVRLCKVYTNLPLLYDEPTDFGVTDYCRKCRKCAEGCEVDAISFEQEPSFKTASQSNNNGIYRWAVNHDKCYEYWVENGMECSTCITVCPFNLRTGGKKDITPKEYWQKKNK